MRALLNMTAFVAFAPGVTIPVPASPSAIAVGAGSVWVLAENRLVEINPHTNTATTHIDLGVRVGSERTCDLAVAGGLVWTIGTKNSSRSLLVRVEARTDRPLGSTSLPAAACVAATRKGAWVTLPDARALVQLDPGVFATGVNHDSGTAVRVDTPCAPFRGSGAITVGNNSLWVVDWRGLGRPGYLRERDAHSGRLLRTFRAGISPIAVASREGAVWVTDYTQPGSIARVAP